MNDYKELIDSLRNPNKVFYETFLNEESKSVESVVAYKAANTIERLVNDHEILAKMYAKVNEELCVRTKERDAYAKAFRITRSDEPLTNHAVFKVDYADIIDHSTDELVLAIAYGLARTIEDARSTGG